ncbi:glycosyl hydrolases family 31-domain-containing protein [Lipomyces tetrasporus]|uniref:Glucoamylase 1 n=1 Tax=Lipomyces tetrasporus TaxID=54092 RepID=A0AAD7QSK4_9ASCO|nr:glycosyl hydrolases family 31-domain-containing protein [Lipomyces tetrasporus]KAJ8100620.1 glycosyl hydrolases family 31-domain-containing protein [Lipomyces tetrasporus]
MLFPTKTASIVTALLAAGSAVSASSAVGKAKSTFSTSVLSSTASATSSAASEVVSLAQWATLGVTQYPNIFDPNAVDANEVCSGYSLTGLKTTKTGLYGRLKLLKACNVYGYDFDELSLIVDYQSAERLNVQIRPIDLTYVYVLPETLVSKPGIDTFTPFIDSDLVFAYTASPFSFTIVRKSTGEILFSTAGNPLVYENQFIQFNTSLPKGHFITGLGESIHGFQQEPGANKTLYANDVGDPIDANIYGVHPIYVDQRYDTNTTHGVYLRNSHAQEVLIRDESLTWRLLGGTLDLYFFSGTTVKDVITQYVSSIGLPNLIPYWSLGFHQCRWGYNSSNRLSEVIENFRKFNIPLETIWTDIDYMDSYKDFTTDPYRYPLEKFQAVLDDLHANHQHFVPIVDAAIYHPSPLNESDIYPVFDDGIAADVYLKNPDGSLYIGAVWPGYTVYPDWLASGAQDWWTKAMVDWHQKVPFDGIWLDMNEVSSFCVGSCGSQNYSQNPVHPPFDVGNPATTFPLGFNMTNSTDLQYYNSVWYTYTHTPEPSTTASTTTSSTTVSTNPMNTKAPGKGNINYPPYAINHQQGTHDLAIHAVSPNATHADGTPEYDVHNLWGYGITNATYNALLEVFPGKRPFIISRSTFPGSGRWTGHWGGDNSADWAYMYFSIPQALSFGLFGIPMFGVDVCGFNGNTDMELCNRWMQLGAFFPFYRNHNYLGAIDQEPYVWESVAEATRTVMAIRYEILPYYYTLMYEASKTGMPALRALSWEFPDDKSLASVETQFLIGEAILVTPVLEPHVNYVKGVFPGVPDEVWYDYYTHEPVSAGPGENITLSAPLGHINVHIRGGYIIPTQKPAYTTTESRKNDWGLTVALDKAGSARGTLYVDDGESVAVEDFLVVDFVATQGSLYTFPRGTYDVCQPLASVTVLGVDSKPRVVSLGESKISNFTYVNNTIFVSNLQALTSAGAWAAPLVISWV